MSKLKGPMVIPTISILDGKFVIPAKDGTHEVVQDEDGAVIDTQAFLEQVVERYGDVVYINDLDGQERNSPQYTLFKKLGDIADLWVDAGSRSGDALIDVIFGGAQKAVLSTRSMGGLDDIAEALDVTDGVLLCIDYDNGVIARSREISKMTPRKLAEAAQKAGLEEIILADHGRKKKEPFDTGMISDILKTKMVVYVGGNILEKDLPIIQRTGAKGALLALGEIIKNW